MASKRAAIIEGQHEGVLVGVPFFKAGLVGGERRVLALGDGLLGIETGLPGAAGCARTHPAGFGVHEVAPVFGSLEHAFGIGAVAEGFCQFGDGEVGAVGFEHFGDGDFVGGWDVAEFERIGEHDPLGAVVFAEARGVSYFEGDVEGGFGVEVLCSEGVDGGENDRRGVSAHDVGAVVGGYPARVGAELFAEVYEGLGEIGGLLREQECLELDGVAVDVPVGDVGVLAFLAGFNFVDFAVHAGVFAVDVAEEGLADEFVVDAGIEDFALGVGAAFDFNVGEGFFPAALGGLADGVEVPAGDFGFEVGDGVVFAGRRRGRL